MKSRKLILVLTSMLLVLSLFLAACGGKDAATDQKDKTSQEDKGSTDKTKDSTDEKDSSSEETSEPKQGGNIILGSIGSPTIFNPYYSTDVPSSEISGFLYNGLLSFNKELEPFGDLATEWVTSEDGLTWSFKLREGVKWHDGEDFTADDVVFSYNIPRHADYSGPRASSFEKITEITKIDDYTVNITLSEPYAPFTGTLSYGILPEHILGDVPIAELGEHAFNTKNPIGTGPFKFVEWKDGQYVKVEAFEGYYEGRPYLDTVTYKIVPDQNALMAQFAAGDVHHISVPSDQLSTANQWVSQGKAELISGPSLGYTYLGYNQLNPLFQDVKVRQALTHALNRQAIIDGVLKGDGSIINAPVSNLSWAYTDKIPGFDYDVEKAKKMLADAGWKDTDGDGILDKDGQKFEFTIKTNQGNAAREKIAVVAQEMFKEVGVKANVSIVEWSAFIEQITAPNWDFDAVILGWSLSVDPDPTNLWHSREREKGLNFVHYSNTAMDELMEANTKILDFEERKAVLQEIFTGIAADQPYSFLYYPNAHAAIPTNLKGKVYAPGASFYEINKWYFDN